MEVPPRKNNYSTLFPGNFLYPKLDQPAYFSPPFLALIPASYLKNICCSFQCSFRVFKAFLLSKTSFRLMASLPSHLIFSFSVKDLTSLQMLIHFFVKFASAFRIEEVIRQTVFTLKSNLYSRSFLLSKHIHQWMRSQLSFVSVRIVGRRHYFKKYL